MTKKSQDTPGKSVISIFGESISQFWSRQFVYGFNVGFSPGSLSRSELLLLFSFSFLDWTRGGHVEDYRWTRNPLVRLRSTPNEDSQPFTSLMVSQSAFYFTFG